MGPILRTEVCRDRQTLLCTLGPFYKAFFDVTRGIRSPTNNTTV